MQEAQQIIDLDEDSPSHINLGPRWSSEEI